LKSKQLIASPSAGNELMANGKHPTEHAYLDIHTRLTKVEGAVEHIEKKITDNKSSTASSIDAIHDKIDEIVQVQARGDHELSNEFRTGLDKTNQRVDTVIETLNKINGKLSIHQFVFGALAAIALAAIGAFFKALIESLWN
jgi:methyl-accepting chemotaxis protein